MKTQSLGVLPPDQTSSNTRLNQNPGAVRRNRLIAGLMQKDLAEAAGISPNHLCNIEKGTRSASVLAIHRIASALDCPVEELIAE